MLPVALALAAQLVNPGFERGILGWWTTGHRGYEASAFGPYQFSSDRAPEGRHWLSIRWTWRSATPPKAEFQVTTRIDARLYRGRRMRASALTRIPEYGHRETWLRVRSYGPSGMSETGTRLDASTAWVRQGVDLAVPRDASTIELAFVLDGRGAELNADAVELVPIR